MNTIGIDCQNIINSYVEDLEKEEHKQKLNKTLRIIKLFKIDDETNCGVLPKELRLPIITHMVMSNFNTKTTLYCGDNEKVMTKYGHWLFHCFRIDEDLERFEYPCDNYNTPGEYLEAIEEANNFGQDYYEEDIYYDRLRDEVNGVFGDGEAERYLLSRVREIIEPQRRLTVERQESFELNVSN